MARFLVDIKSVSKVEFKADSANIAIGNQPQSGQTLVVTGIPFSVASAVQTAKLTVIDKPVSVQLYVESAEPAKPQNEREPLYFAQWQNRLEIRS